MPTMTIRRPNLHPTQREIFDSPARFKVVSCGRRWGKTMLGVLLCLTCALEGGRAWWVAPTYKVGKVGWRRLTALARQIPGVVIRKGDWTIEFPGGGVIEVRSSDNPDSLRGEGLDLIVMDEAAFSAETAWKDSLRPSLADKEGAAVFISTPNGRNWFYRMFLRGLCGDEGWACWQEPSSSNPFLKPAELAAARRDCDDRTWDQEWMAKFVTFKGRVYSGFDPAATHVFTELDLSQYVEFWGGIDLGWTNPTAMVVAGITSDGRWDVIEEVYESGLSIEAMQSEALRLTAEYGVRQFWADPAEPRTIAELQGVGVPVDGAPCVSSEKESSTIMAGIREISMLLEAVPARLRFYAPLTPCTVQDFDRYRYPRGKEDSPLKEKPLKVDDHGCDAVRYMIQGWNDWHGGMGEGLAGGTRESAA